MTSPDASPIPSPPSSPDLFPSLDSTGFLPLIPYTPPLSGTPISSPQRSRANTKECPLPDYGDLPLLRHGFPIFRIKLTLSYIDHFRAINSNTTVIKGHYFNADHANKAAFELAKCCRGEGEVIMLMNQTRYGDDFYLKDEYVVGKWEPHGAITSNNVDLMYEVQRFMARRAKGVITGVVRIFEVEGLH